MAEYWWCVKQGKILLAHTARNRRKDAVDDYARGWPFADSLLGAKWGVVRIRVEEVKKGGRA